MPENDDAYRRRIVRSGKLESDDVLAVELLTGSDLDYIGERHETPRLTSRLTTRSVASGVLAVYSGTAKVGYLAPRGDARLPWHWEMLMVSEQTRGHPQGIAVDQESALAGLERVLERWMLAANMEWKR